MKIVLLLFIALCSTPLSFAQRNEVNHPVKNFEALWKTFDARYGNFELKGIDWQQVYERYRPKVSASTTNQELFEICCAMLQELKDGHVSLEPNFEENDVECGPPYGFTLKEAFSTAAEWKAFSAIMDAELRRNGFSAPTKKFLSEDTHFQYRTSKTLGYLRLDEMTEKITFGKFKRTLDEALLAFRDKKGLILDLRFNGGGWDYIAYQLAKRFVPKGETIGHYERKRIKNTNNYTPMRYREIQTKEEVPFTKPVIILTSNYTASAAEVFLLLMRELPHITLVGENTEGIFSDIFPFRLPNKWQVSLSHQQYFSETKENFEGKGIPSKVRVINSKNNLTEKTDPVLKKALELLEK